MIDFQPLYQALDKAGAEDWVAKLAGQLERAFASQSHGDLSGWRKVVDGLPKFLPSSTDLLNAVRIGRETDLSASDRHCLRAELMKLHPWR